MLVPKQVAFHFPFTECCDPAEETGNDHIGWVGLHQPSASLGHMAIWSSL